MTKHTSQTNTTGGIPEQAAGGVLHIDLDALVSNWRTLRDHAGGAETAAVVKANAYGIGIEKAVPALSKAGCRTFFVAHLSEAIRARAVDPGAAIYVLNGLFTGTCCLLWQFAPKWWSDGGRGFTMVFSGGDQADSWNTIASRLSRLRVRGW